MFDNSKEVPEGKVPQQKKKFFAVFDMATLGVMDMTATRFSLFFNIVNILGRTHYDRDKIFTLFQSYIIEARDVFVFTDEASASKYIQEHNLSGYESGSKTAFYERTINNSDYNGPEYSAFIFEIETETDKEIGSVIRFDNKILPLCRLVSASLEGKKYEIDKQLAEVNVPMVSQPGK